MSGPKVIVVVTRQEVIDTCRAAIAEVNHALLEWQRVMDRNMIIATDDLARLTKSRDSLLRLLAADQFIEVQKAAPSLVGEIRSNAQLQIATQDSRALREKRQERSLQFSAEAVLARCRSMSLNIPAECLRVLTDASAGRGGDAPAIQRAISQATEALYAQEQKTASAKQRDLADVLGRTGDDTCATHVLRDAEASLADPRLTRIAALVAELENLGEDATAATFRSSLERAGNADLKGDKHQKSLLLDSLEIEITPALKRARKIHDLRLAIGAESEKARATGDFEACQSHLSAADEHLRRGDADKATASLAAAQELRGQQSRHRAAQASREAILQGLKDLGYAVQEGMATQLAAKKQLVVRHTGKPGVGVELTGTGDGGRLQARMVAIQGVGRGPETDKQVEEKWCSEFQTLQAAIARAGGLLRVEKASAAGAVPLKTVANDRENDEHREAIRRERSL